MNVWSGFILNIRSPQAPMESVAKHPKVSQLFMTLLPSLELLDTNSNIDSGFFLDFFVGQF